MDPKCKHGIKLGQGCNQCDSMQNINTWRKDLDDIHSSIRVLLHGALVGFEGKTVGSVIEILLPHIKDFISQVEKEAEQRGIQRCIEVIEAKRKEAELLLPLDPKSWVAQASIAVCTDILSSLQDNNKDHE